MANSHTATELLARYGYTQNNKTSRTVKVEWTADSSLPLDVSGKSNMQKIKDMFSGL